MKYKLTILISFLYFFVNSQYSYNYEYSISENLKAHSICPSSDGGSYLAATIDSAGVLDQGFLTRLDSQGNILWSKIFDQDVREVCDVVELSNGDIVCLGNRRNTANSGIAVMRLNSSGSIIWQKQLILDSTVNYSPLPWSLSINLSTSGDLIITGHSSNINCVFKMTSNGNLEWSRKFQCLGSNSIFGAIQCKAASIATLDGGVIYAGYNGKSNTNTGYDGLIVKLDNSGNIVWSNVIDESSEIYFTDVVELPSKNTYAIGFTSALGSQYEDVILAKFNSGGGLIWLKSFKSNLREFSNNLEIQYDELVLTGSISTGTPGEGQGFVMKLDTLGNINHSYLTGSNFSPISSSLLSNGQLLMTGYKWNSTTSRWRINNIMTNSLGAATCDYSDYTTTQLDQMITIDNSLIDLGTCSIENISLSASPITLNHDVICTPSLELEEPTLQSIQVKYFDGVLEFVNKSGNYMDVQFYDIGGSLIKQKRYTSTYNVKENIEHWDNGIYFYKIISPDGIQSDKFLKY